MVMAERASALHTLKLSHDALRFPVKALEGMMSLWNEVTGGGGVDLGTDGGTTCPV